MIFLDLFDLRALRKAVLYFFCVIGAVWLQTMVLPRVEILGARPLFLPALAVAIGVLEGGAWGGAFGMLCGAYFDMTSAGGGVMFLVVLAAVGFFSGLAADYILTRRFFSFCVLAVLALLGAALVQIVPLWVFSGARLADLLPPALLQTLWSLPFVPLCYLLIRRISGRERLR